MPRCPAHGRVAVRRSTRGTWREKRRGHGDRHRDRPGAIERAIDRLRQPTPHAYNAAMGSVADDLRRSNRGKGLSLSPDERLAMTARLAEADVDLFCGAHDTTREAARQVFMRQRRVGRRPSRVMQEAGE